MPEIADEDDDLDPSQIMAKLNGLEHFAVPTGADHLTAFIDVQQKALFYVVCAWASDFTGWVIDYGTWPDQRRHYFTLRDLKMTLAALAPSAGLEGQIYAGLDGATNHLCTTRYLRDDGAEMVIERVLIDANWGQSTDVVYQFCRQSPHAAVLLPSHGRYVGAGSVPFSDYTRKRGDRVGHNWRIPSVTGKRAVRHILYDTNFWKSFIATRLSVALGDRSCLSLWGHHPERHRLFAEHLSAEHRVRTEGRGRVIDEWKPRPERTDNHWLDGVVGAAVAASLQGATVPETGGGGRTARKGRIRLSAIPRLGGSMVRSTSGTDQRVKDLQAEEPLWKTRSGSRAP